MNRPHTPNRAVDPAALRRRLEELVGALDDSLEVALDIDADFVAAYVDLAQVPGRTWLLDDKTRALIMLATTSAVTTLDREGIRTAAVQAHRAGASPRPRGSSLARARRSRRSLRPRHTRRGCVR